MHYDIHDVRLYYETRGEGKPIVMLHGFGCDHRLMQGCMEPVFKHLARGRYRRFYLDLPGMGKSAAPLSYASSDAILETLVSFLQEVVPDGFLLAGQSYGGYLARGIAASLSERMDGLLLICPVAIPTHALRTVPVKNAGMDDEAFLRTLPQKDRDAFCSHAVVASNRTYLRYKEEIAPGLKLADKAFLAALQKNYTFSFAPEEAFGAKPFTKPSLILTGRQDTCVGYQDQWKFMEAYPRATFATLDMAGHNLQLDSPRLFDSLVEDWLDRTETRI